MSYGHYLNQGNLLLLFVPLDRECPDGCQVLTLLTNKMATKEKCDNVWMVWQLFHDGYLIHELL